MGDTFSLVAEGVGLALTWQSLLAIVLGVAAGQILGAIPGLTASMAVALLIPYFAMLSTPPHPLCGLWYAHRWVCGPA